MTDVSCDGCGELFDERAEKGVVKRYPDGTVHATCPSCMKTANQIADAHADP